MKPRIPAFMKTIRFRLAAWYLVVTTLLLAVFIIGINMAMHQSQPAPPPPPFPGDTQSWQQVVQAQRERYMQDLRLYSITGVGVIIILGALGGYALARTMLRPVDRISSLAGRISHTNLKERIAHRGPNDEVKRLSDTFDGMLQRLDTAFELQKQFIQDASHELRTPIAIAQANIEVLEMNKKATAADYKRLVDVIKLSLERMNGVNNNLLLLSEGAPSQAKWAVVDINALLGEVWFETEMAAVVAGVSLELHLPTGSLEVKGDALRLKQAVINLVDNAVKYNRSSGGVSVSASYGDGGVVIEVADTGIGIESGDMEHIFDRFYRVEKSRSRNRGGSGLGLAIVKKVVEDHGGTVLATSEPDKGSTFRITLPRA